MTNANARGAAGPTARLAIYYALVVTETVSLIGSQISQYAVSIAVFRATGHATPLALVVFFSTAPAILLGGFGGALADRFDRRGMMLIANLGFTVVSGLLLLSFASGAFRLWHLYALTLGAALFAALERPAAPGFGRDAGSRQPPRPRQRDRADDRPRRRRHRAGAGRHAVRSGRRRRLDRHRHRDLRRRHRRARHRPHPAAGRDRRGSGDADVGLAPGVRRLPLSGGAAGAARLLRLRIGGQFRRQHRDGAADAVRARAHRQRPAVRRGAGGDERRRDRRRARRQRRRPDRVAHEHGDARDHRRRALHRPRRRRANGARARRESLRDDARAGVRQRSVLSRSCRRRSPPICRGASSRPTCRSPCC